LYKSFRGVLRKKPVEKTPNIREMRPFWKLAIMQRLQPMQNPYFGSKIKIRKNMSKTILQIIYTRCVRKNPSKKHEIFEKWEYFENRPSCKGYSPYTILTLSQKLKFQKTCQNPFRAVLCKKPLEETPDIQEIRPFWKSAIMQRTKIEFGLQNKFQF